MAFKLSTAGFTSVFVARPPIAAGLSPLGRPANIPPFSRVSATTSGPDISRVMRPNAPTFGAVGTQINTRPDRRIARPAAL